MTDQNKLQELFEEYNQYQELPSFPDKDGFISTNQERLYKFSTLLIQALDDNLYPEHNELFKDLVEALNPFIWDNKEDYVGYTQVF